MGNRPYPVQKLIYLLILYVEIEGKIELFSIKILIRINDLVKFLGVVK